MSESSQKSRVILKDRVNTPKQRDLGVPDWNTMTAQQLAEYRAELTQRNAPNAQGLNRAEGIPDYTDEQQLQIDTGSAAHLKKTRESVGEPTDTENAGKNSITLDTTSIWEHLTDVQREEIKAAQTDAEVIAAVEAQIANYRSVEQMQELLLNTLKQKNASGENDTKIAAKENTIVRNRNKREPLEAWLAAHRE